jgi:hypothetical protein
MTNPRDPPEAVTGIPAEKTVSKPNPYCAECHGPRGPILITERGYPNAPIGWDGFEFSCAHHPPTRRLDQAFDDPAYDYSASPSCFSCGRHPSTHKKIDQDTDDGCPLCGFGDLKEDE